MKVHINKITGIDDALVSLLMSKRSWTKEKEEHIRWEIAELTNLAGMPQASPNCGMYDELMKKLDKLLKWGLKHGHTTLLRFIDISITIEGLHRGAQDDLDAHAKRMDNRIVRSSTRLAEFSPGEKSEWYEDRIRTFAEVLDNSPELQKVFPKFIEENGKTFVRTLHGYVRDDLITDKGIDYDVQRGLYPLSIPSNCIFKVQYPELCHIVQHRDAFTHAAPELKLAMESLKEQLTAIYPALGNGLTELKMQPQR